MVRATVDADQRASRGLKETRSNFLWAYLPIPFHLR